MARLTSSDRFGTRCVHAGVEPDAELGSVNPHIDLSTTFVQPDVAAPKRFDYSRGGNLTRAALEAAMADLEQGATGHAFASGLSALDAVLRLLQNGDHVVCAEDAYGGSIRLLRQVASRSGIDTTFVDTRDTDAVQAALRPETRLVLMETPTNPLLRVSDIRATADVAHDHGAMLCVDNTFMSPALQHPLALGADVVFHSATKYIGGHSDVLAGIAVAKDEELGERLAFQQMAVGAVLPPLDCYLLLRGLKTLDLRMQRHCASAQAIAERLARHDAVEKVYFPGLQDHDQHEGHDGHAVHRRQADGPGGMLSFVLPDAETARRVARGTRLWQLAESLGAVESLIQVPAAMTHASVPKEMRDRIGLADGLVRLSVGVEHPDDLWADLEQALA